MGGHAFAIPHDDEFQNSILNTELKTEMRSESIVHFLSKLGGEAKKREAKKNGKEEKRKKPFF